jgi:hypothetical protein
MATWIKYGNEKSPDFLNLEHLVIVRYNSQRDELFIVMTHGDVVISRKKEPTAFQQISDYIKQSTGHDLA